MTYPIRAPTYAPSFGLPGYQPYDARNLKVIKRYSETVQHRFNGLSKMT